ncbi:hypothetical protein DL240_14195 [Lujinxingia litoralis]|uniref:EamA domain-containing protein n=1 Tax=Lujinxingia litoralis TaxID=2211119 RepID=A0A328C3D0_9DELT|nr:EamA family transporter [Lujinxingia litoralis]RAL21271.1 hypothetical protein DL240_14195 [Lujinxingia litoralis]
MLSTLSLGFVLALASASCWAVLDISRKKLGGTMSATGAVAGLMLLQVLYANPVLLAGSLTTVEGPLGESLMAGYPSVPLKYALPASGAVLLNMVANFLFLRAVQISPLSLTTPYLAFTPVFTAVTGLIFLGQAPSGAGWAGIVIVCLGAFFMNPGNKEDGPLAPLKALWTERGSFFMLIVAMIWSFTPILDKSAAEMTSPLFHTMVLAGGVGTIFALSRRVRDGSFGPLIGEFKSTPRWLALGGLFAVGAMAFQLSAYAFIDVAYVETVKRAVGVSAAIAAGYFFFGERNIRRRLVGAAVMCVGVAMILLAG